jgi:hypothetical protein
MTNKIKELAKEAGYIAYAPTDAAFNEFRVEKFAKLIIQECLNDIDYLKLGGYNYLTYDNPRDAVNHALNEAKLKILNTFGIN